MPETEARKKWVKENKQFFGFKMHKTHDADIIEFLQGKQYATVIKAALREYMENHPKKTEHRYGMRLRGFSPGAQPRGSIRREDDHTGKYHDIIVYDRQLSAAEIAEYELDELN